MDFEGPRPSLCGKRENLDQLAQRLFLEKLMRTQDAEEGLRAFLEKRPPLWTQR